MPQVTIYISPATVSSWTVPLDCIKIDSVDCFGAAGSGAANRFDASNPGPTGGGGGAFSRKNNIPVIPTTVMPLAVGLGGAGVNAPNNGNNGGDTWFGSGPLCLAKGGQRGIIGNAGGPGGAASSGIGDVRYSGGRGGNNAGVQQSTAGGGCAGPNGNGVNGADVSSGVASLGGAGDAFAGGAGSQGHTGGGINQPTTSAQGGTGTELGSGFGCGGGSGNSTCIGTALATTGTGGQFGGASGGAHGTSSTSSATSGQAHHGFIVIRYTPVIKVPPFNLPMMGM